MSIQSRFRRAALPGLLSALPLALACDDPARPGPVPCTGPVASGICLDPIATGLRFPLQLEQPAGDDRLFVAEQAGRIRIIRDDELVGQPFLDIADEVMEAPEQGLIGMAFHPHFQANGRVFVAYTDLEGNTSVERFTVGSDPDLLDVGTRTPILVVQKQPGPHNGGLLRFGPDGLLWIGVGDANRAGEAQDPAILYGSLLRIDVDGGEPYAIPSDNPYAGDPQARPEIWATGLRNPWRYSFESGGRLFIADVGQSEWEELNIVPDDVGGLDYGWPILEGSQCFRAESCDPGDTVLPVFEYDHSVGCSILGGAIYEGTELPALDGRYVLADYCGWVGSVAVDGTSVSDLRILDFGQIGVITSLGFDADGRVYVLGEATVSRMRPAPAESTE